MPGCTGPGSRSRTADDVEKAKAWAKKEKAAAKARQVVGSNAWWVHWAETGMTVPHMKLKLQRRRRPTTGIKADLQRRLIHDLKAHPHKVELELHDKFFDAKVIAGRFTCWCRGEPRAVCTITEGTQKNERGIMFIRCVNAGSWDGTSASSGCGLRFSMDALRNKTQAWIDGEKPEPYDYDFNEDFC